MATAAMAVSGLWTKTSSRAPDVLVSSQEVRAQNTGSDNVQYRLSDETSNLHGLLPALKEVPTRSRGRRRRRYGRGWQDKQTDSEFDIVIVPSDGCYMSGSDSDDSDWSVGWFEPHPADFSENEAEESFAVLVPSYRLSSHEFSAQSKSQSEDKDSNFPAWAAALLAYVSSHANSETQQQLDLWLASLTS